MPIIIVTNACERNCPKCDDGLGLKTMLPEVLAREIKPRTNLFHFRSSYNHLISEVSESFDWATCSNDLMELVRQDIENQTN